MRTIATARPNPMYENLMSISDLILEAQLSNNQITYYETHSKDSQWNVCLKESTVHELFAIDKPIRERPFLARKNRDFFAVLNRSKELYREKFIKLKNPKL
jgi:hypothetical protein